MPRHYVATDGKLVLYLHPDRERGGYVLTCPFNPELTTEGETIEEAFAMAYDAQKELRKSRAQMASQHRRAIRNSARRQAASKPSPKPRSARGRRR